MTDGTHGEGAAPLRSLPSVEALAGRLGEPRHLAVEAAREAIAAERERLLAGRQAQGEDALAEQAAVLLRELAEPSLRPVVNATGVILHTNLGRAPLAPEAVEAAAAIGRGYSTLEYDLERGERGARHAHVEGPLRAVTGAQAAIAVNNNAAAVVLCLAALAAEREVVIGRGQLVEIGGSFRIPEILAASGARLVEVGTTNRTRIEDYERAIGGETAAVMRVHQSNFRIAGFTEEAPLAELAALCAERGIALIDDLGSGAVEEVGDEPRIRGSLEAGADLVCFSGDKLLGGPQAGVICGRAEAVQRCREHPLARALRLDKLQLAALEATLRLHRDRGPGALPALAMMEAGEAELLARASSIAREVGDRARVERGASAPGGGALPAMALDGPVCSVAPGPAGAEALVTALRAADPPVIARIVEDRVVLDPRTMDEGEARHAAHAVAASLDGV